MTEKDRMALNQKLKDLDSQARRELIAAPYEQATACEIE